VGVVRQAQRRTIGRAGGEGRQIDARRHDVDAARVGAVVLHELVPFLAGGRDEPVGLGDHLLLADDPAQRLRRVAGGQGSVLDLAERVRGVHEWHAPAVAGQPPDLSGQPVVGVDEVVPALLVVCLGAQHGGGERAQLSGQLVLAEPSNGPALMWRTTTPGCISTHAAGRWTSPG